MTKSAHSSNYGTTGFIISTVSYALIYRGYNIDGLLVATVVSGFVALVFSVFLSKEKFIDVCNEYKLNDYSSRKINKELRKLKVPKQEYIIQDYYDDDCNKYDAILICEIKEDMKYISLEFNNKIYELLSIKNL